MAMDADILAAEIMAAEDAVIAQYLTGEILTPQQASEFRLARCKAMAEAVIYHIDVAAHIRQLEVQVNTYTGHGWTAPSTGPIS